MAFRFKVTYEDGKVVEVTSKAVDKVAAEASPHFSFERPLTASLVIALETLKRLGHEPAEVAFDEWLRRVDDVESDEIPARPTAPAQPRVTSLS